MTTYLESRDDLRAIIDPPNPLIEEKVLDKLDDFARDFISRSPFLVLSTADAQGRIDASPKGDAPGFVEVVDGQTLLVPDRPGNKLAYGHENVIQNPRVGLLFFMPNTNETLRVNGTARLTADPEVLKRLAARERPAVLALEVSVEECFFHCGKAFIRSGLWAPDSWPEPGKVSFGKIFAARRGADQQLADAVDAQVEDDYKNNL